MNPHQPRRPTSPAASWTAMAKSAVSVVIVAASMASPATLASTADPWVPPGGQAFGVGDRLEVNGVPMQLRGFVSPQSVDAVVHALRSRWPRPFTEDRVGARRIFGRMVGDQWVTVQLEPTPDGGTRGLSSVVSMREALKAGREGSGPDEVRWLPVGSALVQHQQSHDAGRRGSLIVARNHLAAAANAEHLINRLAADGLVLERRVKPPPGAVAGNQVLHGEVLTFGAPDRQAMAVISRDARGDTTLVLTSRHRQETSR
jgi:hypothetical protein